MDYGNAPTRGHYSSPYYIELSIWNSTRISLVTLVSRIPDDLKNPTLISNRDTNEVVDDILLVLKDLEYVETHLFRGMDEVISTRLRNMIHSTENKIDEILITPPHGLMEDILSALSTLLVALETDINDYKKDLEC